MNILERLKSATGPDREIDALIWVALKGGDARMHSFSSSSKEFVWERGIDGMWVRSIADLKTVMRYTASIDAALALVERMLPDAEFELSNSEEGLWYFRFLGGVHHEQIRMMRKAATPALAILTALFTALATEDE